MSEITTPLDDEGLGRAHRGEYEARISDWMSRGWTVFTREGGLFIGFSAILWLVHWVAPPLLLILGPMLIAGILVAALIARRGEKVEFSDFWLGFNDFQIGRAHV